MKKYFTYIIAGLVVATLSWAGDHPSGAKHESHKSTTETVTMTGQIIDPVCFLDHGASGPDHRACAQACAKMGINLAFYHDLDHQLYMIRPTGHADPNEKVVDFAEKHVEITGIIYQFPGYQGLEVQSIKELGEGRKISLQQEEK